MSTNYVDTFIRIADDCPVEVAEAPPSRGGRATVAGLQHDLVTRHPYELTSDDLLFEVHALRQEIAPEHRTAQREVFFARSQACLRASPLPKRYGWGIHHDRDGRIALVALGSEQYQALADDPTLTQLKAMRSSRG